MDDSDRAVKSNSVIPAKAGIQPRLVGLVVLAGLLVLVGAGCTTTTKTVPTEQAPVVVTIPSSTIAALQGDPCENSDASALQRDDCQNFLNKKFASLPAIKKIMARMSPELRNEINYQVATSSSSGDTYFFVVSVTDKASDITPVRNVPISVFVFGVILPNAKDAIISPSIGLQQLTDKDTPAMDAPFPKFSSVEILAAPNRIGFVMQAVGVGFSKIGGVARTSVTDAWKIGVQYDPAVNKLSTCGFHRAKTASEADSYYSGWDEEKSNGGVNIGAPESFTTYNSLCK